MHHPAVFITETKMFIKRVYWMNRSCIQDMAVSRIYYYHVYVLVCRVNNDEGVDQISLYNSQMTCNYCPTRETSFCAVLAASEKLTLILSLIVCRILIEPVIFGILSLCELVVVAVVVVVVSLLGL
jgi:hypothetical protein